MVADYMCKEEREERDLPVLKIARTNRYNNSKTTKKSVKRLITATRNSTNDTRTSGMTITRKQKWEEKQLNGRFKQRTSDISQDKTWM